MNERVANLIARLKSGGSTQDRLDAIEMLTELSRDRAAPEPCVLRDGVIYCQCGKPSAHYGTMGERGAREVRCEPPPTPPPSVTPDPDAMGRAVLGVQEFADQYVDDYEMLGEDDQGRDGYYTPKDDERALIRDAVNGLIADEDFVTAMGLEYVERQKMRATEGRCLECGCPAGDHYGNCSTATKDLGVGMKPIVIALANNPDAKPMPEWIAYEVPDTEGVMAVHRVASWNQQPHQSRWTATHIPSGRSIPVPYWCGQDKAAWYAKQFFDEAQKHGIDMHSKEPLDGLPKELRTKLRAVLDREPPEPLPSYSSPGEEVR